MNTVVKQSLTLLSLLLSYSTIAEPLYFKASKGEKELMVLGSIHMGHPDMYPLPIAITEFLEKSDTVITEIKLTDDTPFINIKTTSTSEVLNDEQKRQLGEITQQLGFRANAFLANPAWQTALTLQVAQFAKMGLRQDLGIDAYITEQATQLGKKIIGLESMEFQLRLFTDDPNVGELLLTDTIDNWQENQKVSQCLAQSWQAGNKQQLAELTTQSAIGDELADQFIYQRNQDWSEKLDSDTFIANGQYLVVVGALHLVGKDNLMTLLRKKGFTVSQLSKEEPLDCI